MDKKMYIDGVDVSECKHFYSDEMCDNEQTLSCVCVKNKECEYKQLKRLQTENAELKQENEWLEKEVEMWIYQADKRAKLSNIRFNTAETYKQALQDIREYCEEQNLKADYTACEIIDKINEVIK